MLFDQRSIDYVIAYRASRGARELAELLAWLAALRKRHAEHHRQLLRWFERNK